MVQDSDLLVVWDPEKPQQTTESSLSPILQL